MVRCYEKNLTVELENNLRSAFKQLVVLFRQRNVWSRRRKRKLYPQTFTEAAKITTFDLLPAKSRKKYDMAYKAFLKKRHVRSRKTFSWYTSPSKQRNPSPPRYDLCSILKSTISIHHDTHVETYHQLQGFLKRQSENYQAKNRKRSHLQKLKNS